MPEVNSETDKNKKEKDECLISAPWSTKREEVLERCGVSQKKGLKDEEAEKRLKKFGANKFKDVEKKSKLAILKD